MADAVRQHRLQLIKVAPHDIRLSYFRLEPLIRLRCLYLVAERRRNPRFVLIRKVLFRVAFAGFILLQIVLLGLIAAGISTLFPSDKYFVQGDRLYLALAALLLIGAGSYLEFRRMRRAEYVSAESEKWLAERRHPGPRLLKRRKTIKKWAVRIPTAIVVLTWAFLDEAWSFASHVLHPHSGKLIGYQVSILLTCTIPSYTSSTYNGEYAHSIVVATIQRPIAGVEPPIRRGKAIVLRSQRSQPARSSRQARCRLGTGPSLAGKRLRLAG